MCDRPELVGVLHYIEFELKITISGKPVFIFSREKEFVALQFQETIAVSIVAALHDNMATTKKLKKRFALINN
jgi:hypothetical protein